MTAVFTVFFEGPFWVGILESEDEGHLSVARHVFGSEPSNAELRDFMLYRFADMRRVEKRSEGSGRLESSAVNPKRAQRMAIRDARRAPSTKAQAALSAALEERKAERASTSRDDRRAEAERLFELRSEKRKRKRKHSGH